MLDYHKLAKAVEAAEEGNASALEVYAILKDDLKVLQSAIKQIEPDALEEAFSNYSEKTFTDHGFKFEKRNGGSTYKFDHIPQWVKKQKELKEIEMKAKQMYDGYKKGMQVADENGEVYLPIVEGRKDSIVIKKI